MDCPTCGESFASEAATKIHHSKAHGESIAGIEVECSACGETFRKQRSNAEKYDRHFCSVECKSDGYKDRVTTDCDWCGEEFTRRRSAYESAERHYCSTECKGLAYRDRLELECAHCGTDFTRLRAEAVRAEQHFCSTDCRNAHQRGANHPSYNGAKGLTTALRRRMGGETWRSVREELHSSREEKCRMCGATESDPDRTLETHHIVPLMAGGSHHRENLMFLCYGCHGKAERFTERVLEYPIADLIQQHGD